MEKMERRQSPRFSHRPTWKQSCGYMHTCPRALIHGESVLPLSTETLDRQSQAAYRIPIMVNSQSISNWISPLPPPLVLEGERERVAHTVLCQHGFRKQLPKSEKRMELWSAITSQLVIQWSKCSNVAEKETDSRPTLHKVTMISQDVQGGGEMALIKCGPPIEQRGESN